MLTAEGFREEFNRFLEEHNHSDTPQTLYDPVVYIMNLGGKRVRPVLALMTTALLGGDYKSALPAALSLEVFHNFSLVHDDIMDEAPIRRGKPSVHAKWDVNTAILSGDVMLIAAYQLLESYDAKLFKQLVPLFTRTAREVCEGQQYDMDFETLDTVTLKEYLRMIRLKTGVLIGAAMQMGAIIAQQPKSVQRQCYDIGLNLGMAFQLQDDYLDAFADPSKFGKQVGGDILEKKKTYLYLRALEQATPADQDRLRTWYRQDGRIEADEVQSVIEIFETASAADNLSAVREYTFKAHEGIEALDADPSERKILKDYAEQLMGRIH